MNSEILRTDDSYFDSIRPYLDSEVDSILPALIQDKTVRGILTKVFGNIPDTELDNMIKATHSIETFKTKFMVPVVGKVIHDTTFSLTWSGKSKLDRTGKIKYLFISNHRDITLDSAFLNYLCVEAGLPIPRIAIGDNLLIQPWIRDVVRLSDAFIVRRHPSMREMIVESKRLSSYIRSSVVSNDASVWLAQSEGRRKDSDDRTQPAVLKMLSLSGGKDETLEELFESLKITPIAITYEYDPCDYLKAQEMLAKHLDPSWQKRPEDDYINMQTGLKGYKGRVHFSVGDTLRDLHAIVDPEDTKQEKLDKVANEINRQIFTNYRFYPNNYIAFDFLHGGKPFGKMYSEKEKNAFSEYLEQQIAKVGAGKEHYDFIRERILGMYATPLKNHLITTKQYRG